MSNKNLNRKKVMLDERNQTAESTSKCNITKYF